MEERDVKFEEVLEEGLRESSKIKLFGKSFNMPDIFIILMTVLMLAVLGTHLIPAGSFDVKHQSYIENGQKIEKQVVDPNSFHFAYENGEVLKTKANLFEDYNKSQKIGAFNAVFEGFVDGGRNGSPALIVFVLVIGGAFGVVLRTGTIETGIMLMMKKHKDKDKLIIGALFLIFSLGGAVFGMGEETMAFSMITVPLFVGLGYDTFTAVMVTFVSTQIGFGTSWMNPFSIAIAQNIAGLPILSGAGFRIIMWAVFTLFGMIYTLRYASKIKKNPELSPCFKVDEKLREKLIGKNSEINMQRAFQIGDILVLLTLVLTIAWVIYGVTAKQWYIAEMTTQFFIMGIATGIIGVVFKLNEMMINDVSTSFMDGVKDLAMCAILVGLCRGIILVIGGTANDVPTILNTILFGVSKILQGLSPIISGIGMFFFQTIINFALSASIAQASLTMPLMSSLSDLLGVSRQVACLAFQLGDAFTNVINPLCPIPLVILAISGMDFPSWFKWQLKFQACLFGMGAFAIAIAVLIGY